MRVVDRDRLRSLESDANACRQCGLYQNSRHLVFCRHTLPEERTRPVIMFVGEGPGRQEDATGKPFVGAAGCLLDIMIRWMGNEGQRLFDYYVTNVVKHWSRTPQGKNVPPTTEQAETCSSLFLVREINLVQPDAIVALGAVATRWVAGRDSRLGDLRNDVLHDILTERRNRVFATYHPAYLLRNLKDVARINASKTDLRRVCGFLNLPLPDLRRSIRGKIQYGGA